MHIAANAFTIFFWLLPSEVAAANHLRHHSHITSDSSLHPFRLTWILSIIIHLHQKLEDAYCVFFVLLFQHGVTCFTWHMSTRKTSRCGSITQLQLLQPESQQAHLHIHKWWYRLTYTRQAKGMEAWEYCTVNPQTSPWAHSHFRFNK